jgi:hypothetical protein
MSLILQIVRRVHTSGINPLPYKTRTLRTEGVRHPSRAITPKNEKPTWTRVSGTWAWNFFVYGGSRSAAASGQKCVVRDSNSSRSNNTRAGRSFALPKKVTLHASHCQRPLPKQKADSCERYFRCRTRRRGYVAPKPEGHKVPP